MNRGSQSLDRVAVEVAAASMRPRFMNRGSADLGEIGDVCQLLLQ